jgi:hypothetical protein
MTDQFQLRFDIRLSHVLAPTFQIALPTIPHEPA